MVEVTQEDCVAAARHTTGPFRNTFLEEAFARHRIAAFADGFSAALQGAEALTWGIEDDSFLYESVSEALQEVISELQAMERNWTGRATVDHRIAAEQRGKLEGARLAIEAVLPVVVTDRTIDAHGAHCCCTTCELNIAEDDIRALDPAKIVEEG